MTINNFRKIGIAILTGIIIFTVVGCSSSKASFTPGTYTGTGDGKDGDVTVETTFSKEKIESIKITVNNETQGLGDVAVTKIAEEIVKNQSLAVDIVSGATYSSKATLQAVEDCVTQAGGDMSTLK